MSREQISPAEPNVTLDRSGQESAPSHQSRHGEIIPELYSIWREIVAEDPAKLRWAAANRDLNVREKLILRRYTLAETLRQIFEERGITEAAISEGGALRTFTVKDFLTAVGEERGAPHDAFGDLLTPSKDKAIEFGRQKKEFGIYIEFIRWEIGGREPASESDELLPLGWESLAKFLEGSRPSGNLTNAEWRQLKVKRAMKILTNKFKDNVITRYFPLRGSRGNIGEKTSREWCELWERVANFVDICSNAGLDELDINGFKLTIYDVLFPVYAIEKTGISVEEIFARFDEELRAIAERNPKLEYYLEPAQAASVRHLQYAVETCCKKYFEGYTIRGAYFDDVSGGDRRMADGGKDSSISPEFANATTIPMPPAIAALWKSIVSVRSSPPPDKRRFIEEVEETLRINNYCIRINPEGYIAKRMYINSSGSIGFCCTNGATPGFSRRTSSKKHEQRIIELVPYVRPK